MHTIKLLLTYYLNISVQYKRQIYQIAESNRKNRFGSENQIESNRNFFARIGMLYLPLQLWQGCQVCVKISAQRLSRVAQFYAC